MEKSSNLFPMSAKTQLWTKAWTVLSKDTSKPQMKLQEIPGWTSNFAGNLKKKKKTGRVFCNFELWPWWQKRPSNDHGQSVHSFLPFLPFLDTYLSLMSSEYGSLSYLWRSLLTSFWWNILQTLEVKVTLFHPLRSCLHERPSDPGAPSSIWKSQMDTKKRLVFQQNFRTRKYVTFI